MKIKKTIKIIGILLLTLALGLAFLPWQRWVEGKLIAAITARGISPVALTIDRVGLNGLVLKDIALGDPPLKLANLTVGYAPRALLNGEINEVTLEGLNIAASQEKNGWSIPGFDAVLATDPDQPAKPVQIPVTRAALGLPLSILTVDNSTLEVRMSGWQLTAPLKLRLAAAEGPRLTFESSGLSAVKEADTLTTGKLALTLTLNEEKQQWEGNWTLEEIMLVNEAITMPPLKAEGSLTLVADAIAMKGKAYDKTKTHNAAFAVDYSLSKPQTSLAVISSATMPWGGGTIGASKVRLPLDGKKATTLTLNIKQVTLATLMKLLTNDSANATGVVSGTLPITLSPEGKITIGTGNLKAEEPGVISLPPDTIPGDNQQVALVRDVLKNLHYSLLSLDLATAPDKTLSITLAVEGKNPDVEKGRPIKLKVHLSGDLLNLMTQNLKLMTDPTNFIKQEAND